MGIKSHPNLGREERIRFWVSHVITTIDVAICEDSGATTLE